MRTVCRLEVDNEGPVFSVVNMDTRADIILRTCSSLSRHRIHLSPLPDDLKVVVSKTQTRMLDCYSRWITACCFEQEGCSMKISVTARSRPIRYALWRCIWSNSACKSMLDTRRETYGTDQLARFL